MREKTDKSPETPGLAALLALPTEIAKEYVQWPQTSNNPPSTPPPTTYLLSDVEVRLLQTVIAHPTTPSSALPKLLRISTRRAIEVRDDLVTRGFLRAHRVNTSARGRTAILLEPLPPALAALGMMPSDSETSS